METLVKLESLVGNEYYSDEDCSVDFIYFSHHDQMATNNKIVTINMPDS